MKSLGRQLRGVPRALCSPYTAGRITVAPVVAIPDRPAAHRHHANKRQYSTHPPAMASAISPSLLQQLQDFWFPTDAAGCTVPKKELTMRWFQGGQELDQACVARFKPTLEAIRAGQPSGDALIDAVKPSHPHDWMNLVILLDQIPRNCYRGPSASAVFTEFDPLALSVAREAIRRGIPQMPEVRWRFGYRSWFYLPLEHAEDLALHEEAMAAFQATVDDVEQLLLLNESDADGIKGETVKIVRADPEAARAVARLNLEFERKHYDIIRRFGRYPHRNEALGRQPTEEEEAYLRDGGETFTN